MPSWESRVAELSREPRSGRVMAMVGGTLVALVLGKNDPGFAYNGPLAGLVAELRLGWNRPGWG